MTIPALDRPPHATAVALARTAQFPRLRYMGSKYKLTAALAEVFAECGGQTALDAFSGSGVVSYLLKSLGFQVTSNDFLAFPSIIAAATVVNDDVVLSLADVAAICSPSADGRDFIAKTFKGIYFDATDLAFLDSAWSHIDALEGTKRALAVSALVLAAAKKQPRGVFSFAQTRYDDGRRDLRIPMSQQFRECVQAYNAVVVESTGGHVALHGDVFDLATRQWDVVYLDPPYAPPTDDNCYIKRYHFLEGLSVYWRGQTIMAGTKTKKLEKRYTPFSYKHSVGQALDRVFDQFSESDVVLSYSSNAVPDVDEIRALMRRHKPKVDVRTIDHRYSFGTHAAARRRVATELLFVGRS